MSKDVVKGQPSNSPSSLPSGTKSTGKKIKPKPEMNPPSPKQGDRGEYK